MIYGKRIRLRGIEREDIPRLTAWFNDPEVTRGLLTYYPIAVWQEEGWFESLKKLPREERPLMIEVREGEDWIPIGDCNFHEINWRVRSAELGIAIGEKAYWNQGYGTETMELLLRFGFETLNLNRIFLKVHETNRRAIRAYEKAGFVHEGRMRQAHYTRGKYEDILWMSVLRSEWLSSERNA